MKKPSPEQNPYFPTLLIHAIVIYTFLYQFLKRPEKKTGLIFEISFFFLGTQRKRIKNNEKMYFGHGRRLEQRNNGFKQTLAQLPATFLRFKFLNYQSVY